MDQSTKKNEIDLPNKNGISGNPIPQEIMDYDSNRYNFVGIVTSVFFSPPDQDLKDNKKNINPDLATKLQSLQPHTTSPRYLTQKNDQLTWYHKRYNHSTLVQQQLIPLYMSFLNEYIFPRFVQEGETSVYIQKTPTLRVHFPSNLAVSAMHKDGDYFHPQGEVNYWLPLTEVFGNNGFWIESEPGKADYKPIAPMKVGQVLRFNGNRCNHFNKENDTGVTRASLDFRVVPGSLYSTLWPDLQDNSNQQDKEQQQPQPQPQQEEEEEEENLEHVDAGAEDDPANTEEWETGLVTPHLPISIEAQKVMKHYYIKVHLIH